MPADLGTLVYKAITGKSPASEPTDVARQITLIRSHFPSAAAMARAMGLQARTVRSWTSGKSKPSPASRRGLTAVVRRLRLTELRQRKIIAAQSPFDDTIRILKPYDGRTATLNRRSLRWEPIGAQRIITAYLSGASTDVLADEFVQAVREPWYREGLRIGLTGEDLEDDQIGIEVTALRLPPYTWEH